MLFWAFSHVNSFFKISIYIINICVLSLRNLPSTSAVKPYMENTIIRPLRKLQKYLGNQQLLITKITMQYLRYGQLFFVYKQEFWRFINIKRRDNIIFLRFFEIVNLRLCHDYFTYISTFHRFIPIFVTIYRVKKIIHTNLEIGQSIYYWSKI